MVYIHVESYIVQSFYFVTVNLFILCFYSYFYSKSTSNASVVVQRFAFLAAAFWTLYSVCQCFYQYVMINLSAHKLSM